MNGFIKAFSLAFVEMQKSFSFRVLTPNQTPCYKGFMTYYESADGFKLNRAECLKVLDKHGIELNHDPELSQWLDSALKSGPVDAQTLLEWIGY